MTTKEASSTAFSPVSTKVLVVGAGGIGCELLKNLVLSGYTRSVKVEDRLRALSDKSVGHLLRKDLAIDNARPRR